MIFRAVCLMILVSFSLNTHAQLIDYSRWSQEEKENKSLELINEAKYVVEGQIVKFECFYGDDGKTIYTDITVRVSNWYKGRGSDMIHIIRKGGVIGEDNQYGEHWSGPYTPMGGQIYILLLKQHSSGENYVFSRFSDLVVANSTDDFYMVGFHGLIFDNAEEFNQFIAKGKKIRLPNKKKDVGYIKSSIVPVIEFINTVPFDEANPPNPANPVTRAGTGEIIVISGSGFGNVRGDVLFIDADKPEEFLYGPPVYLTGLDDIYYDTSDPNNDNDDGWKDDEIRVIVPSKVFENSFPGVPGHGAGSGKIKVKTPDVFDDYGNLVTPSAVSNLSPQILTIEYALRNFGEYDIEQQTDRPMSAPMMGMEHCLSGYVFTLHRSFDPVYTHLSSTQQQDAINSIESALTAWGDLLGITLELEKNADDSYYYHPATGEINRNIISFVNFIDTPGEITNKLMRAQSRGIEWDDMCSTSSDCLPRVSRITGSNILIKKDDTNDNNIANDWFYAPTGAIQDGGPLLDFYAAMLHEIGHAIGVDHDVKLNIAGQINRQNLMSYGFVSQQRSEAQRINLTNQANDKGIDAAEKIIEDSRNHSWSDDFFDRFGIQTLADEEDLSVVQSTPQINVMNYFSPLDPTKPVPGYLYVEPYHFFNPPPHDNHWLPKNSASSFYDIRNICGGRRGTYYVRIKDDACTISSIYSLPYQIPVRDLRICNRAMREDLLSIDKQTLRIYPNPNNGHFDIRFESLAEEETPDIISNTHIGIYDNLGRLQHQHSVSDATLRQTTIDISTLPVGMYWVVWFVDGEVIETQQLQKTD